MFTDHVTFPAAFLAGLLSFFSPCILPVLPGYFAFIAGTSFDHLAGRKGSYSRYKLFLATLAFVLGFSFVFIALGASASLLGGLVETYKNVLRIAGGIIIIVLGAHIAGIYRIRFLDVEKRLHLVKRPAHFASTFVIGMAFGAGWSPCIGPMLGSILIIAGSKETVLNGMLLLSVYSAGMAVPFLVLALFAHSLAAFLKRVVRAMRYVNGVAGGLLILVGLALIFDRLSFI